VRQSKQEMSTKTESEKLVGAESLLKILWPNEDDRPSLRWLRDQQKTRRVPFIKMGRLVFFEPETVRAAIASRFTITARGAQ
jgi:hypothetical protein